MSRDLKIPRREFLAATAVTLTSGAMLRKNPIIRKDPTVSKDLLFDIQSVEANDMMVGSISTDGERIFVGSLQDNKIHCFNIEGQSNEVNWLTQHKDLRNTSYVNDKIDKDHPLTKEWSTDVKSPGYSQCMIQGNNLYASMKNRVYCIDKRNGEKKWTHKDKQHYTYHTLGRDGNLYVASVKSVSPEFIQTRRPKPEYFEGPSYITKFDSTTGEKKWEKEFDIITGRLAYYDNKIFFGNHSNRIFAIGTDEGKIKWTKETKDVVCDTTPTIDRKNNTVFVGSHDNNMYALNTKNGDVKWVNKDSNKTLISGPVLTDSGLLCYGSFDKNVYAVSSRTGDLVWKVNVGDVMYTSPTYDGEKLYVVTVNEGKIYAINEKNGKIEWDTKKLQPLGFNEPVLIGDMMFISGGVSNYVHQFRIR